MEFDRFVRSVITDIAVVFSDIDPPNLLNPLTPSFLYPLAGKTMDSLGTLRLSYTHNHSEKLTLASQLDYRIKGSPWQKLSVGSRYLMGDESIVKAKIDSNAIIASSFTHQLSKFVKLTLCAEVDIKDLSAPDSHKFGVGLSFE